MAKKPRISNHYSTGGGGYDFEQDKFNFREMVKKSLNLFKK